MTARAGDPAPAAAPPPGRAAAPPLRRARAGRLLGGVCAGLGRRLGIDPLILRLAFVAAAVSGGVGVALYVLAWIAIPPAEEDDAPRTRLGAAASNWQVGAGVGLLVLTALLIFRELGIWFSDALVWPVVLAATGAALIWRQSAIASAPPAAAAPESSLAREATAPPLRPLAAAMPRLGRPAARRVGIGVALVVAAGLVFLWANGALDAAGDAILSALVVAVALTLILAPWWWRLARNLAAERAERIRSQERAEVAAHLHDSVLQTLALVQRRADDPRQVATLARRQERELRAWLSGRTPHPGTATLAAALESAAAEVEHDHGTAIDVVAVGDRPLDARAEALVAAAREALVNAAKFAPGAPVSVYAEARPEAIEVFVRDRGPGFDPAAVPPDRRGLRESIVGRMERHGGRAVVRSAPGEGTEVELAIGGMA